MTMLTAHQIKYSLAPVILSALLAACGGGSGQDDSKIASTSSSSTESVQASTRSTHNEVPLQAGPAANLAAMGVSSALEGPAGQDSSGYVLTFHDSFDGELDRTRWNTDQFAPSTAPTNYKTTDGALKIWPERGGNGEFFKRTLDTNGRFLQRYGYFEIEAKLPKGKGVWPAFWLLNMEGSHRPEIDIMEAYPGGEAPWAAPGADGVPVATMYAPVVWTDAGQRAGYGKIATPNLSESFHRYGTKWEPNKVTFYFDGREVYSLDVAVSDPLHMIISLWFGSASGEPDSTTPTGESNSLEINYVKAWQFK